ncbi:MAG: hypothetical protein M1587_00105, partial [Thaumarchaeota archaeon]|nr:hypothetical protein [Nitrososphaerota archaeon]
MSTLEDPRYRSRGQPHEYETVEAFRRKNPYFLYEEEKARMAIPPSEESELARQEERVKAFEARAGTALLKRSREDPPATLAMPDTSFATKLGWWSLGIVSGIGVVALIARYKPGWFTWLG